MHNDQRYANRRTHRLPGRPDGRGQRIQSLIEPVDLLRLDETQMALGECEFRTPDRVPQ